MFGSCPAEPSPPPPNEHSSLCAGITMEEQLTIGMKSMPVQCQRALQTEDKMTLACVIRKPRPRSHPAGLEPELLYFGGFHLLLFGWTKLLRNLHWEEKKMHLLSITSVLIPKSGWMVVSDTIVRLFVVYQSRRQLEKWLSLRIPYKLKEEPKYQLALMYGRVAENDGKAHNIS